MRVHQGSFYFVFFACVLAAMRVGTQRAAAPLLWIAAICNALIPLTALLLNATPANWFEPLHKPYQSGFVFLELLCLLLAIFFGWLTWRQERKPFAQAATQPQSSQPRASAANNASLQTNAD